MANSVELYSCLNYFLRGKSPEDLHKEYKIAKKRIEGILKDLENLNLLERLPDNKIHLLVSGSHNLIRGGPLQHKFVLQHFISLLTHNIKLAGPDEPSKDHLMTGSWLRMGKDTLATICRELNALFYSYRCRAQRDEVILDDSDLTDVSWVICISPFEDPFLKILRDLAH